MKREKRDSREIPAGEFKARCLKLMEDVRTSHQSVVITKRGKPVARLVPIEENAPALFGCLEGTVTVLGDIVAPTGESWEADG